MDTKARLEAAIDAHFAAMCDGATSTAYVLQVVGESFDDDSHGWSMLQESLDGQPFITTLGLLTYAQTSLTAKVTETPIE